MNRLPIQREQLEDRLLGEAGPRASRGANRVRYRGTSGGDSTATQRLRILAQVATGREATNRGGFEQPRRGDRNWNRITERLGRNHRARSQASGNHQPNRGTWPRFSPRKARRVARLRHLTARSSSRCAGRPQSNPRSTRTLSRAGRQVYLGAGFREWRSKL